MWKEEQCETWTPHSPLPTFKSARQAFELLSRGQAMVTELQLPGQILDTRRLGMSPLPR